MRHLIAAALLEAMALAGPARAAPQTDTTESLTAQARAVYEAFQSRDADRAEALARATIARPDFSTAPATLQRSVRGLLALVLAYQHKCTEARAIAQDFMTTTPHAQDTWLLEFLSAYGCDEHAAATAALEEIVRNFPDMLKRFEDGAILRYAMYSRDAATLSFLVNGSWKPADDALDLSSLRLALVRAYLATGDRAHAAEAAQGLVTNGGNGMDTIVVLLTDKTFDDIVAADPTTFDFDAIVAWRLTNAKQRMDAAPTSLSALSEYARALFQRNRVAEAKALLDHALAEINAHPDAPPFSDVDTQLNWIHDLESRIEDAMGDNQAALTALQHGAETLENGTPNVSQTLNLGMMRVQLGQPARALAGIEHFDPANASPYGRMVWRNVRACAYAQLHDDAHMREALDEMLAHGEDSPVGLYQAAICAGDYDLAARSFIAEFDDPTQRSNAILSLQHFTGERHDVTPPEAEDYRRIQTLLQRPDVSAAIERACHVRTFSIRRPQG